MKHSFFCTHSFLVFLLSITFLISAKKSPIGAHIGGKAVKADIVAILSGLKKIAESSSFKKDLAQLVEKHTAKLTIKKEQFKDLKEFLTIFNELMKIDRAQLMLEQHEYIQKRNELYKRQVDDKISHQELELLFQAIEKGQLIEKQEKLWQQFNNKFEFSDLFDAMKVVFGQQYDMVLVNLFAQIGSNATESAIKVIDRKLNYKKKRKKI